MAQLLASMKHPDGRTIVEGLYEGMDLTREDHEVLDSVPDDLEAIKRRLGSACPIRWGDSLQEVIQYPSLNIRGLRSACVGSEVRTIVPDRAVTAIDFRLVKESWRRSSSPWPIPSPSSSPSPLPSGVPRGSSG